MKNIGEIKPIPEEFIGRGEVKKKSFKRIKASERAYLYEVDGLYYEVFKRSINKLYNTETYPSSKQFGVNAFTYRSKKTALAKFKVLDKISKVKDE